jgi:hypothetical protein
MRVVGFLSPEAVTAALHRHGMQVVTRHALSYLPVYYVRIPDPGRTWALIQERLRSINFDAAIDTAIILRTEQGRQPTHYVGRLIAGKYYDDRLMVLFTSQVSEDEAHSWLRTNGLTAIRQYPFPTDSAISEDSSIAGPIAPRRRVRHCVWQHGPGCGDTRRGALAAARHPAGRAHNPVATAPRPHALGEGAA